MMHSATLKQSMAKVQGDLEMLLAYSKELKDHALREALSSRSPAV